MLFFFFELLIFCDTFLLHFTPTLTVNLTQSSGDMRQHCQNCEAFERRQLFPSCISFTHVELRDPFLIECTMTVLLDVFFLMYSISVHCYFLAALAN